VNHFLEDAFFIIKQGGDSMIELQNISVHFYQKEKVIRAVGEVNLSIAKGDIYGIVGYSGAGKSTLVRVMNFLQKPTEGEVIIHQTNLGKLSPKELRKERKSIGMIFQHFNLMENRTIFDNVDFSLKYTGKSKQERRQKVNELLELVGLEEKTSSYPSQLSGGQKQRVAIARALANEPKVLLCDEATSALDPKTTQQILKLLKKLNRQLGLTIVLITHEMQVVKEICNKVAVMENGRIIENGSSVQIFSHPKEELTKDFIRTATHLDQALEKIQEHEVFADQLANKWLIELSYVGTQTNEPLIAQLYSKYQVTANILYGNVEWLQETPLGSLIVTLAGETIQKQKELDYLKRLGVRVNILQKHESQDAIKLIEGGV
jgi:D-methionine transport system ATP-binding protein